MTTHDPELVERVAQAAWQAYVVEVGRSLPEGLADKLARAVLDAITETRWKIVEQPDPNGPLAEITMYQARCTGCGTVEDDYGEYAAWSDPSTPVDSVIENDGWLGRWDKPTGRISATGREIMELSTLLCPRCQKCEVCGDASAYVVDDHAVCEDHEDHDFARAAESASTTPENEEGK